MDRSTALDVDRKTEQRIGRDDITYDDIASDDIVDGPTASVSFGSCLRNLRKRIDAKQSNLSFWIGCTDAAISLWESGLRLPRRRTFARLLVGVASAGATATELRLLKSAWVAETNHRRPGRVIRDVTEHPGTDPLLPQTSRASCRANV